MPRAGDRRDESALVPAPAVEVLVDVEVGRERVEVDRCPQPEELRVGDGRSRRTALADRTDPPRAIAATERLARSQIGEFAVDLDPALPSPELGETGVVEHHAEADLLVEMGLLDRCRASHEREVGAQPVLGGFHDDAQCVQRFEHLDANGSDLVRVGTVRWSATRCVHTDLAGIDRATVDDDAERRVGDVAVRVEAHRQREEETGVLRVAVEEVSVVVVDVGRPRLGDRV